MVKYSATHGIIWGWAILRNDQSSYEEMNKDRKAGSMLEIVYSTTDV